MKFLTLEQTCEYLDAATIERTIDEGHCFVHIGRGALGARFVLVNNAQGETVLIETAM